jgi:hypothetical protein
MVRAGPSVNTDRRAMLSKVPRSGMITAMTIPANRMPGKSGDD